MALVILSFLGYINLKWWCNFVPSPCLYKILGPPITNALGNKCSTLKHWSFWKWNFNYRLQCCTFLWSMLKQQRKKCQSSHTASTCIVPSSPQLTSETGPDARRTLRLENAICSTCLLCLWSKKTKTGTNSTAIRVNKPLQILLTLEHFNWPRKKKPPSIPTLSEPAAGFRAPSAVLCSNEGVWGKLGDDVRCTASEPRVLLSKMWKSGREVLSKQDRRRHQHKVKERESKSPCLDMQFFWAPHKWCLLSIMKQNQTQTD